MSEEQTKETKKPFIKNPKVIFTICIVVLIAILLAVFKYKALLPIVVLLVVVVAIAVNRSILKKRKGRNTEEVTQCDLPDSDRIKFAGYFVSQDEQYISSLGNGYIMNFLASGTLKRGFAVISNKRVYFRGSCYSGQGKSLVKTDEERTVDIKDVTGSGFIYRRYLGVLIGLLMALVVLLAGIAGSLYGVGYQWNEISSYQSKASEAQASIKEEKDNPDTIVEESTDEIEANEGNIEKLQDKLNGLRELQKQQVRINAKKATIDAIPQEVWNLFGYLDSEGQRTGLNSILYEYFLENYEIYSRSKLAEIVNNVYENAKLSSDSEIKNTIISNIEWGNEHGMQQEYLSYLVYANIYFSRDTQWNQPRSSVSVCRQMYNEVTNYVISLYELCGEDSERIQQYISEGTFEILDDVEVRRVAEKLVSEEEAASYQKAMESCLEKISPELLEIGYVKVEDIVYQYVKYHPDEFTDWFVFPSVDENVTTEYDSEIEELESKIEELKQTNSRLTADYERLSEKQQKEQQEKKAAYERRYQQNMSNASAAFTFATIDAAIGGLLITFFISCFLVFLEYLKKRKTMFQIQYAGGFIAFDVSYYAKAEIEDFQKQLRRTKDYVEEAKTTVNVAPAPAPVQTETPQTTQSSTPDDLRKYAELLKDGLISQEDYDAMKKKILGL
ncbi:MAG: SHOCT domain-containing protein [Lachnospiraceae bacterium]|nr:SHOCT domain-containing protein [Lachnospiraceae bacterium]